METVLPTPWVIPGHLLSNGTEQYCGSTIVGAKGASLARLPHDWTPPFFVITVDAYKSWISRFNANSSDILVTPKWLTMQRLISEALQSLELGGQAMLLARSSAEQETLRDRGRYDSILCKCDIHSISDGVVRIWRGFYEQQSAGADAGIAVIVQRHVTATAAGHLANERRVSRSPRQWLCELEDGLQQKTKHIMFRTTGHNTAEEINLKCSTADELKLRLQEIAESFTVQAGRHHFEWVWDSNKLWVVQWDHEEEFRGPRPGALYRDAVATDPVGTLRVFVPEQQTKGSWRKIEALRTFRSCGLPTAQVFVLENQRTQKELAGGRISKRLQGDLLQLLKAPIVIRTDVDSVLPREHFLLPRTDSVRSVEGAADFLQTTTAKLVRDGLAPGQFCFIAHRFIPAAACAQSFNPPGVPRVRVDSSWGLPDGLQFYPHDSFEVDLSRNNAIKQRIRSKVEYFDVDELGRWVDRKSGAPWDWKPSLTKAQVIEIARYTSKIALYLKKPVDVMFFVDVSGSTGHPAGPCLPWYYTTEGIQDTSEPRAYGRFGINRLTVSNDRDLELLTRKADAAASNVRSLHIHLRPIPDLVRSTEFLENVGALCINRGMAIELEGSILSHAYYVLSRLGVKIRCVDPFQPRSRPLKFGKLVRNLIPLRIVSRGEAARVQRVSATQLVQLLKAKAVEEALELNAEEGAEGTLEELADVLEVISTICDLYDHSFDELLRVAERKRAERGGFEKGFVLVQTEEVPLIRVGANSLFSGSRAEVTEGQIIETQAATESTTEVRRVRSIVRGLIISLVPPTGGRQHDSLVVPIRGTELEAVIEYREKEISVTVQPLSDSDPDRRQLLLPFVRTD